MPRKKAEEDVKLPVKAESQAVDTEAPDNALVAEAVEFINSTAAKHVYKGYLEIGDYVLKNFFNNDIELALSKNPRKPASFVALCRNEKLTIHPSRLSLMVRVAAQEKLFLDNKLDTDKLSFTQKTELVKVDDGEAKVKLVKRLLKKHHSTRETEQLVQEYRQKQPRNEKPIMKSLLNAVDRHSRLFQDSQFGELLSGDDTLAEQLTEIRPKAKEKLRGSVREMLDRYKQWAEQYEMLLTRLEGVTDTPGSKMDESQE
ncbi:hypothetical protein ACFL2Q_00095 [Thermodesulfobacteriota bacterium]